MGTGFVAQTGRVQGGTRGGARGNQGPGGQRVSLENCGGGRPGGTRGGDQGEPEGEAWACRSRDIPVRGR